MKQIAQRTLRAWALEEQARARLERNANAVNLREWRRRQREARALERDWWSRSDRVIG